MARKNRDEQERAPDRQDADQTNSKLGGRTLGELGTTGGTNIGAGMQEEIENATVGGDRLAAGRAYHPGIDGRTSRGGNLGSNIAQEVTGREQVNPSPPRDKDVRDDEEEER